VKAIGVVPQKAQLFAGSIRDNLQLGRAKASDDELWEALSVAQAKDVVAAKPGQLDFKLEQGGRNLSGGQKQRLTIARALVTHPQILLLDDSASALDFATDANLRQAIHNLSGNLTTFIVSQRAASIMQADQILVLSDGQVAGLGSHEQLLATCPVYQEIFYSQFPEKRKPVQG
jgi:ABC-type multidrug transport system fused ATPase/permease subunit